MKIFISDGRAVALCPASGNAVRAWERCLSCVFRRDCYGARLEYELVYP
jgi:hypothetical protein